MTTRHYRCRSVTAQSPGKKPVARIAAACARGNCRPVVPVRRFAAGGIFRALRTRRIVEAPARWPSWSSSPWTGWYPQPWFPAASRPVSAAISALTGGRPGRFGSVRFRVTRRRCHPSTAPGA